MLGKLFDAFELFRKILRQFALGRLVDILGDRLRQLGQVEGILTEFGEIQSCSWPSRGRLEDKRVFGNLKFSRWFV